MLFWCSMFINVSVCFNETKTSINICVVSYNFRVNLEVLTAHSEVWTQLYSFTYTFIVADHR